jgi:MHS family citrate/tricarballylate:H+ symporter-like MFS transporter
LIVQTRSKPNQNPRLGPFGAIFRVTAGNFLEQFDFFLFGFYATQIAAAFFPSTNEFASLLLTFAVFGAGFLMRPLGAIVLGAYMDEAGRRKGLIVTLAIMAAGTMTIAFVPTYATIGVLAPVLVLVGRLLQGFSAGAEIGGVSVYLAEIARPGAAGFYTSWQSASQQLAIVLASSLGYALNVWMSPRTIAAWGWRVPFVIGCLIVPLLFILRRSLEETGVFKDRPRPPGARELFAIMRKNWPLYITGMLLVSMTTTTFYLITVYAPTFGRSVLKLSVKDSLLVTLCVGISNFVWLPIGGALSDRIGRRPILTTISILAIVTAWPALSWLVAAPSFERMLGVLLWFSFFFGMYNGAMVVALIEVMPVQARVAGFSLAFSLATAVFGGLTPLISTWLISVTGDRASPAYWMTLAAVCGLVATTIFYSKSAADNRGAWKKTGDEPYLPVSPGRHGE